MDYTLAAYDAAYLALAKTSNVQLWTGDRRFYDAVKDKVTTVHWIGDFTN